MSEILLTLGIEQEPSTFLGVVGIIGIVRNARNFRTVKIRTPLLSLEIASHRSPFIPFYLTLSLPLLRICVLLFHVLNRLWLLSAN